MGKTLFFNIPATGHINPSQPLVKELIRRGERVICVNIEEVREQTAAAGADFKPYPYMPELKGLIERTSGGTIPRNALALTQIGERILPAVLEMLREEKPDYVMFDSLCAWAKHATKMLGIPSVATMATMLIAPGTLPPFTPAMILQTIAQTIPVLPAYFETARRMQRKLNVRPGGLFNAVMSTGDLNIAFTSAEFQPGSERFGETFKFVGPSIGDARPAVDFPFEQLTGRPLVYISLGTINNDNLNFYRACLAAFADHPGQFVLSVGKKTDLKALGHIPANFLVRNFVPQLDILERADLFITHGGLNSVSEGLWYGLPLIAIPQQVEQAVSAMQVAKLGAGLALGLRPPFGRVTPAELRAAVGEILSNRAPYQQAAKRLGDSFRQAGGYQRAADEILAFARSKQRIPA